MINKMIGIIKINKKGITAKCGFKYLRFRPQMTVLSNRKLIAYKDKTYPIYPYKISESLIFVSFDESDILDEKMSVIILKNCKVLSAEEAMIYREIITTSSQPVLSIRLASNNLPIYIFDPSDYIILDISSFPSVTSSDPSISSIHDVRKIIKSDSSIELRSSRILSILDGHPSHIAHTTISQGQMNAIHFERFLRHYRSAFEKIGVDLNDFITFDVLDLATIKQINIFNPDILYKTCKIIEIQSNNVVHIANGISAKISNHILPRKFYYIIIPTYSHKLLPIKGNKKPGMCLHTVIRTQNQEMVLVKFNRKSIKRFLKDNILSDFRL